MSKSVEQVDWSRMEAGRELDALVAERVMGFEWRYVRALGETNFVHVLLHPSTHDINGRYNRAGLRQPRHPSYSTDMAAAWLVVEHADADPEGAGLLLRRVHCAGEIFHTARFGRSAPEAEAPTAQLAICRAALASIRTPHEEGESDGQR